MTSRLILIGLLAALFTGCEGCGDDAPPSMPDDMDDHDGEIGDPPACASDQERIDGECVDVTGMTCDEGVPMSLLGSCTAKHRECDVEADGVRCGECLEGFEPGDDAGGPCVIVGCVDLRCGHFACAEAAGDTPARCTQECLEGFEGDECTAANDCAEVNKETESDGECGDCVAGFVADPDGGAACVELPECSCDESEMCDEASQECEPRCEAPQIWGNEIDMCRAEIVCADLDCGPGTRCDEHGDGEDAICERIECDDEEGLDSVGACRACASTPTCTNEELFSGRVLYTSAGCRCEPATGFFSNALGSAERCDRDGDGWLTDRAAAVIGAAHPLLAGCELITISEIRLINDARQVRNVAVSPELPLYEHPSDDGDPAAQALPIYGAARIEPEAANSFTKGCIAEHTDLNNNGVDDVAEHASSDLSVTNIEATYERYREFTYFFELADGWYSGAAIYTIRERSRSMDADHFPLVYPAGANAYWRECTRHADVAYEDVFADQIGRDFPSAPAADTPLDDWGGMNHHSQFKCVLVVASNDYDAAAEVEAHKVYALAGGIRWAGGEADTDAWSRAWYRNACESTGSYSDPPSGSGVRLPLFDCTSESLAGVTPGTVMWASVGYESGSQASARYERGCINECAEHASLPAGKQCPSRGGVGFGCRADSAAFGELRCGCKRNFGGLDCSIPCTNDELLTSIPDSQFPDTDEGESAGDSALRSGYWMCGGFAASTTSTLSGGDYTLRGEVSATPVDGTVLNGGGYTLRAR